MVDGWDLEEEVGLYASLPVFPQILELIRELSLLTRVCVVGPLWVFSSPFQLLSDSDSGYPDIPVIIQQFSPFVGP